VSDQLRSPAASPLGKGPRLGGPQDRSGPCGEVKNLTSYRNSNSDPLVAQPVASRYTDRAIPAFVNRIWEKTYSPVPLSRAAIKSWAQNNNRGIQQNRFSSVPCTHEEGNTDNSETLTPTTDQVHGTVLFEIVAVYAENPMKP
jgi:hypothetical protein